ncbi:MAG: quinolinate synthase NadA [Oligoflexia bacterium]|nr:quinolinate synthase NadA [Oligoflexia bacterium]
MNTEMEIKLDDISDSEVIERIKELKHELSDQVTILGHHYQQDDIIAFADITGDSLILSQEAAKIKKPYTIFCGVHFMAETADILAKNKEQKIILPDLEAGCSMADMAQVDDVRAAMNLFKDIFSNSKKNNNNNNKEKIVPITYVNSSAAIKAFVGEHDGYVCTSSNAEKIIKEAFKVGKRAFFLPDQHLGRNTCYKLGIPLEEMYLYDPHENQQNHQNHHNNDLQKQISKAKVILWNGYCSVHQGFSVEQIENVRKTSPETKIIVHPECPFDVVMKSDLAGSTAYICKVIAEAAKGTKFAVGTEINLVNRLAQKYKTEKEIKSLSPYQCICSTMYRIKPKALLSALLSIKNKRPINVIKVDEQIKKMALKAINRMLAIS